MRHIFIGDPIADQCLSDGDLVIHIHGISLLTCQSQAFHSYSPGKLVNTHDRDVGEDISESDQTDTNLRTATGCID